MRLAYFNFTINFGGAPQSMLAMAAGLARRHEVHVLDAYGRCEPYLRAVEQAGLPCHVLLPEARHQYIGHRGRARRIVSALRQLPELLRLRRRLSRTLRRLDPDLIWVMNSKSLAFVATTGSARRRPLVLCVRGWATPDQIDPALRALIRRVDAVLAVSRPTIEQLRRAGVPEDKLHLGRSVLDLEAIRRRAAEPLPAPLPGRDHALRILLLGARPEHAKGYHTAIRALARVRRAGLDAVLWLPGRPALGAGEAYVRSLEALAVELGVTDCVHLLGWRDDMPRLIAASDVCVLPSHTEGLPRGVLEALVIGRPVAATPVGGVPDVIVDGQTGLLFDVDDDEALAGCILRFARDPEAAREIAEAGRQRVCEQFDPQRVLTGIEALFAELVRKRRR